MAFQRENQRIAASEILQQLADAQDIKLDACTITGTLDLNRLFVKDENFDTQNLTLHSTDNTKTITLPQAITLRSCTFEGDVLFAPPWDRLDDIQVIFKRDAIFNSSIFHGQVRFSKAVFHGLAGFDGCTFQKVACFRSATFTAKAMYRTVTFNGYGLFNKAVFEKEARFTNTCFTKGANFTEVNFSGITDFTGVYAGSKSVPVYESVTFARRRYGDDETFWRFIKQAAQEAGYYQLAGESFYNERCGHFWKKFRGPAYHELSKIRKFTKKTTLRIRRKARKGHRSKCTDYSRLRIILRLTPCLAHIPRQLPNRFTAVNGIYGRHVFFNHHIHDVGFWGHVPRQGRPPDKMCRNVRITKRSVPDGTIRCLPRKTFLKRITNPHIKQNHRN